MEKVADDIVSRSSKFNGESLRQQLKEKGYVVVPNVVPLAECDKYIKQYQQWLSKFGEDHSPAWTRSIIQHYRVAHMEPTWKVRLWAKPVFESIWETKKLLSSMDGIAIGEPPELGRTSFREPDTNWFHIDQGFWREGLHVYQGAVYLQETTEEDHCFRVVEGTSNNHTKFFDKFPNAAKAASGSDFYRLNSKHVIWHKENGGKEKIIPVPKGGMVLWDSRNVHDNVPPLQGRANPDRWRYVVFVSMSPAIWAKEEDLRLKNQAYNDMVGTAHWSSQGVWLFPSTAEAKNCKKKKIVEAIKELPAFAKTKAVKLLAGVELYDFDDGNSNGPGWEPKWKVDQHVVQERDLSDDFQQELS